MTTPRPPADRVEVALSLGEGTVDLTTRALVVAVVPTPRWGREAEVLAGVTAAASSGADLVEVPVEPRLLGPAAASGGVPVVATVNSAADAAAARAAGAGLLLVPPASLAEVMQEQPLAAEPPGAGQPHVPPVAVLLPDAHGVLAARQDDATSALPRALDTLGLGAIDRVIETALALGIGARLVRTRDIRQARRVVEVMTAVLEARR
jgi:hypothetical protein